MDLVESKAEDRTITTYSLQSLDIGSYPFQISDSMVKENSVQIYCRIYEKGLQFIYDVWRLILQQTTITVRI